jgi:1-acyl-sn-glycerol-3-phosphate acyltransferase
MWVAITPEGTRSYTDHIKSGFYRIARGADVPIILGFLDYGRRRIGLGPTLELSGDWEKDLAYCREFYEDIQGRWPEKAGPVTLAGDPQSEKTRKKKATR